MAVEEEIVVITGANTGIGFEIAKVLLQDHGDRFYVLLGCRNVDKGESALEKLRSQGFTACEVLHIDNTNADLIQQAVKSVEVTFGRVDVLHLNVS